jgi:hypothetical protein
MEDAEKICPSAGKIRGAPSESIPDPEEGLPSDTALGFHVPVMVVVG